MNIIERDIITRCLHVVYGQLLTEDAGVGLKSIESLIALVRYMARPESPVFTVQEELWVIGQVFQIYQAEDGPSFHVDAGGLDVHMQVKHNALVYEICQHGMELQHNGCQLRSVALFQDHGRLSYTFMDADGQSYEGMIYEEEAGPEEGV